MKVARPKTEKWHNWQEGDCGAPIKNYFKKGFWKRSDRKKFFRRLEKLYGKINDEL